MDQAKKTRGCRSIALFLCSVLFIAGCESREKAIVDWTGISITKDIYDIPSSDLDAAMDMYAYASEEDIEEANQLTDQIVKQNFGFETVVDLKKIAIDEMVKHRIYEEVFQYIWDEATVDILSMKEYQDYIGRVNQYNEVVASQEGLDTAEYIEEAYHMTKDEYRQYEEARFAEYYLLKSILEQEGITVSRLEIENKWSELAEEEDMSIEEAQEVFLVEDIEYIIICDKFYSFVLDRYQVEIQQACAEMEAKFGLT